MRALRRGRRGGTRVGRRPTAKPLSARSGEDARRQGVAVHLRPAEAEQKHQPTPFEPGMPGNENAFSAIKPKNIHTSPDFANHFYRRTGAALSAPRRAGAVYKSNCAASDAAIFSASSADGAETYSLRSGSVPEGRTTALLPPPKFTESTLDFGRPVFSLSR